MDTKSHIDKNILSPRSMDPDDLWGHMNSFTYKGTLTLKNLDNGQPCESWDALYHTGHYLCIAAMRLKRTRDKTIITHINKSLDVILTHGINFRGFNSQGEYWKDYLLEKYYPQWGDKMVFRDTSRDQILGLNMGLYFLYDCLKYESPEYEAILDKVNKIAKLARNTLKQNNYDLGTTYGDCQTYRLPFSLLYNMLLDEKFREKLHHSQKSKWYFRIYSLLQPILWSIPRIHRNQYFSLELSLQTLFLIANCFNKGNDGTYKQKIRKNAVKGMKRLVKFCKDDDNLYFEALYQYTTGENLYDRNYLVDLEQIFSEFFRNEVKTQDFIWQRHPKFRYKPREEWKNFYAPYHDYLIIYEMNQLMN